MSVRFYLIVEFICLFILANYTIRNNAICHSELVEESL
jgi:hypothetical protein